MVVINYAQGLLWSRDEKKVPDDVYDIGVVRL